MRKSSLLNPILVFLLAVVVIAFILNFSSQSSSQDQLSSRAILIKSALEKIPEKLKSQTCEFKVSKILWDLTEHERDFTVRNLLQTQLAEFQIQRGENQACRYDVALEIYTTESPTLLVLSVFEVATKNKVLEISETAKKNPDDFSSGSK